MKVTYNRKAKALYVKIKKGKLWRTKDFGNGIFMDVDARGDVLGIEALGVERKPQVKNKKKVKSILIDGDWPTFKICYREVTICKDLLGDSGLMKLEIGANGDDSFQETDPFWKTEELPLPEAYHYT